VLAQHNQYAKKHDIVVSTDEGVTNTFELHEEQTFIGVIAVTQACCEPFLQSSTERWGLHFAQGSAAMPWCWVTAELYEEQTSIGVIAMAQACCQAVLQRSTEQWELHFSQGSEAMPWCWVTA